MGVECHGVILGFAQEEGKVVGGPGSIPPVEGEELLDPEETLVNNVGGWSR